METVTLYRPVGPRELALIEASGWREFPGRVPVDVLGGGPVAGDAD